MVYIGVYLFYRCLFFVVFWVLGWTLGFKDIEVNKR